jgi:hypothetical protein
MAVINQSNQNFTTSGTTVAVTLASAVTAGSVLAIFTVGDGTSLSVADNLGNSYQTATSQHIYYVTSAAAGSTTVTLTSTAAVTYQELIVVEINQANAGGGFDKATSASGSGTAASTSITTAVANEIVLGYLDSGSGTSLAVGSGYTLIESDIGLVEYKIQATAAATTATATQGTSTWTMYAAAFKPQTTTSKHFLGLLGCGK